MARIKLPPNPDNYMVPSKIQAWFAGLNEDGSVGSYYDLGSIRDISLPLTDTYLDHFSAHEGIESWDKSVITRLEGSVNLSIDELVGNNLLLLFKNTTPVDTAGVTEVLGTKRIRLVGTTAVDIDTQAVEETNIDYLELTIDCVRSNDGDVTYVAGVDYTFTQAAGTGTARTPATIARTIASTIPSGAEVHITYRYNRDSNIHIIQEGSVLEGALKLQLLNRIGPLCVWEFPFVSVTLNGDITVNPAEWMVVALMFKILTPGDGVRGRFHLFDNFQKLLASDLVTC